MIVPDSQDASTLKSATGGRIKGHEQSIYDLIVVGAGPAGSNAATVALRGGLKVAQIDRATFPRVKPCAGGITPRGVRALRHQLTDPSLCNHVEFNIWRSKKQRFRHKNPILYLVYRPEFDHWLIQQNLTTRKFTFFPGERVEEICFDGIFEVRTSRHTLFGRQLVGADGAYSIVNRHFQISRPPAVATAVEVNLNQSRCRYPDTVCASFDYGAVPHGYGWVFPKRDHWSVGLYTLEEKLSGIRDLLRDYIRDRGFQVDGDPLDDLQGHRIPVGGSQLSALSVPVYLAGDAAGLADAITGEGIFHALESGRLAGETAVLVQRGSVSPLRYYNALANRVLPDTRLSWKLSKIVYARPEACLKGLSILGLWRPLIQGYSEGATLNDCLIRPARLWFRSLGAASVHTCKWSSINEKR